METKRKLKLYTPSQTENQETPPFIDTAFAIELRFLFNLFYSQILRYLLVFFCYQIILYLDLVYFSIKLGGHAILLLGLNVIF